ncbi:hypothetical protein J8I87_23415 [Paraburkholderia sp. LEh10]|uniref:hypothetical protein n=1 Tax=Paraburkholderia sp. LEh10 TaxID=2821353 RepID=UPI001AE4694A|nr:hypothetical protein [Paraburkholderia sp. LEh10]MBP0592632.1 hypothetical protein [Paraburkholderia sp. LEh10]
MVSNPVVMYAPDSSSPLADCNLWSVTLAAGYKVVHRTAWRENTVAAYALKGFLRFAQDHSIDLRCAFDESAAGNAGCLAASVGQFKLD